MLILESFFRKKFVAYIIRNLAGLMSTKEKKKEWIKVMDDERKEDSYSYYIFTKNFN